MPDLTMEDALRLAGSLVTIGHPYQQAAINATAWDLIQMCKGVFIDGKPLTPIQQAEALIEAVRNWEEGWPDRGGTRRLKDLAREMFAPKELEWKPASAGTLVQRGLLTPPCVLCEPGAEYCEWGGARRHEQANVVNHKLEADWTARLAAAAEADEKKLRGLAKFKPITEEDMQRARDDEKRRKETQLQKLEEDPGE